MAVCFSKGEASIEQGWDNMKKNYQGVYFYKINILKAEGMLQVLAINEQTPFYKFFRKGKDISIIKYKDP